MTNISDARRASGNPTVPSTPSTWPPQTSAYGPSIALSGLVGIPRASYMASARATCSTASSSCTSAREQTTRKAKSSM